MEVHNVTVKVAGVKKRLLWKWLAWHLNYICWCCNILIFSNLTLCIFDALQSPIGKLGGTRTHNNLHGSADVIPYTNKIAYKCSKVYASTLLKHQNHYDIKNIYRVVPSSKHGKLSQKLNPEPCYTEWKHMYKAFTNRAVVKILGVAFKYF